MHKLRKRSGSAYTLVLVVFIFVSMFSALMMSMLSQSIFENHAYGMQMQCYYLNNQAAKATVAVLLKDDNALLNKATTQPSYFPTWDIMEHKDASGNKIGESRIDLKREHLDYYGDNALWVVAEITTTIKDTRAQRSGQDFTYKGTAMVLVENPLIQLFNMNPEDFA